ncbi:unnamed protein product [Blepharisma stoltei]|uniref:Uncharacterized protein n=1 Tax=Blepharisma stoltei TaxID=1481888 RepID=A0AAU9INZ5_9CILI|nr:unnamed protein product [Blepharisma stoltei]
MKNSQNLFCLDMRSISPHSRKYMYAKSVSPIGRKRETDTSLFGSPIFNSSKKIIVNGDDLIDLKYLLEKSLLDISASKGIDSARMLYCQKKEKELISDMKKRNKHLHRKIQKSSALAVSSKPSSSNTYLINPLGFPKRKSSIFLRRFSNPKNPQPIQFEKSISINKICSHQNRPSLKKETSKTPDPSQEKTQINVKFSSSRRSIYLSRKKSHRSDSSESSTDFDADKSLTPRNISITN